MKKVMILGTGGNSIDLLDLIRDINQTAPQFECVGFLDDDPVKLNTQIAGKTVKGSLKDAGVFQDCYFVNGIGNASNFILKQQIIEKTGINKDRFVSLIHPTAFVSKESDIKNGSVIFPNVVINSNVTIGHHVIILSNTVISHDCSIDDYSCIAAGVCVSGGVKIGPHCYIGSNASVKENINIDRYCLVGIGSTVLDDIKENTVVVGTPARLLRRTDAMANK